MYQQETSKLVSSRAFRHVVDGVVYASNSSLGASTGVKLLESYQLPVLAIRGVVTSSPLAARETALATGLSVLNTEKLCNQANSLISSWIKFPVTVSV